MIVCKTADVNTELLT
jgi:tRNA (uracil-5-)-methyltransferase